MNDFEFVIDLLSKTGVASNCIADLKLTIRNINALMSNDVLRMQKQLDASFKKYHDEIDELHRIAGVLPASSNKPIKHNPRKELQYITDRIPAYVALRELKGETRDQAMKYLLHRFYPKRKNLTM